MFSLIPRGWADRCGPRLSPRCVYSQFISRAATIDRSVRATPSMEGKSNAASGPDKVPRNASLMRRYSARWKLYRSAVGNKLNPFFTSRSSNSLFLTPRWPSFPPIALQPRHLRGRSYPPNSAEQSATNRNGFGSCVILRRSYILRYVRRKLAREGKEESTNDTARAQGRKRWRNRYGLHRCANNSRHVPPMDSHG